MVVEGDDNDAPCADDEEVMGVDVGGVVFVLVVVVFKKPLWNMDSALPTYLSGDQTSIPLLNGQTTSNSSSLLLLSLTTGFVLFKRWLLTTLINSDVKAAWIRVISHTLPGVPGLQSSVPQPPFNPSPLPSALKIEVVEAMS